MERGLRRLHTETRSIFTSSDVRIWLRWLVFDGKVRRRDPFDFYRLFKRAVEAMRTESFPLFFLFPRRGRPSLFLRSPADLYSSPRLACKLISLLLLPTGSQLLQYFDAYSHCDAVDPFFISFSWFRSQSWFSFHLSHCSEGFLYRPDICDGGVWFSSAIYYEAFLVELIFFSFSPSLSPVSQNLDLVVYVNAFRL